MEIMKNQLPKKNKLTRLSKCLLPQEWHPILAHTKGQQLVESSAEHLLVDPEKKVTIRT